jgi:hypothetical protein
MSHFKGRVQADDPSLPMLSELQGLDAESIFEMCESDSPRAGERRESGTCSGKVRVRPTH